MIQRCISLLVLLAFVAGQWASIPHGHAAFSLASQREHDTRPHIHLGLDRHSHEGGHSHAGHFHDYQTANPSPGFIQSGWTCISGLGVEHDGDAAYLPDGVFSIGANAERFSTLDRLLWSFVRPLTPPLQDIQGVFVSLHPPDGDAPEGKLFLKLRNLRI